MKMTLYKIDVIFISQSTLQISLDGEGFFLEWGGLEPSK